MKLLLDTHTLLWILSSPKVLSNKAEKAITTASNIIYVSAASLWEIMIKNSNGKLAIPGDIEEQIKLHNFLQLPISFRHTIGIKDLPKIHGDPFDRLLISQALEEDLTIITRDEIIAKYPGIKTIKA